ncbi:hypothetical protein GCM10022280_09360 [Sphingomonas swuensis]|uniref:Uncharacterized protein n=2 Tax=Sphingomonas swuensis TaxID=977800 RepID=A0ABP7SL74_9SPHN
MKGGLGKDCVLFDELPVLTYRSIGLTLTTRDDYGDTGPDLSQLGSSVLINGLTVHRASTEGGELTYSITAMSGGPDTAVLLWYKPNDTLLWIRCRSAADCKVAEQIAGSVKFGSAAESCQQMEADLLLAEQKTGQPSPPLIRQCQRR